MTVVVLGTCACSIPRPCAYVFLWLAAESYYQPR